MKVILLANTDWYLYNFRLSLAEAIRAQGHEVVLVSPEGRFTGKLEAAGFRCISLPLVRRRLNPLTELVTVFRLAAIYHRERPDLVHHFTVKCVLYGSIAARLSRVRAVVNALAGLGHSYADNSLSSRMLRVVINNLCKLAPRRSQVIFQNPDDQRTYLERGLVSPECSHLIKSSGVDVTRFTPAADSESPKDKRHVLFASRLLWTKGVAEFVEAARLVREEMPQSVFVMAGSTDVGNPATVPAETIETWRREEDLELMGHVEDIKPLLKKSDLVVLPSYYREGVPRILVEAAACGRALIATDMPGCREVVSHGKNGLLIQPRNAAQLATAIKTLLVDHETRAEMGRQSRLLACREFTQEQVIKQTLEVYRTALRQSRSGQHSPLVHAANNVRVRRASQAMSNATGLAELLEALREMLEFDEFVYVNMRLERYGRDFEDLQPVSRDKQLASVSGVEVRDGAIHWSWKRSGTKEDEVLGASDYWSLRLPISTERARWGFINLYQEADGDRLNVNINYLSQIFQPELARAVERLMLAE
ncbi:MAG TPA: glycosyltransferase family 4 protein [Pyrinomonadaceae bacterium]|nr:glycosyltransferase family 4 protein [Pyrinomonadaceae bacterium]